VSRTAIQGPVVFTDGCSTTFASCCVPANPAMSGRKKIGTTLSLTRRSYSGAQKCLHIEFFRDFQGALKAVQNLLSPEEYYFYSR
jgi:hypothetical protein